MPGPYAGALQQPMLYDPNLMQAIQQIMSALGPYAGPAAGGLATAGALAPAIGYAADPAIRQGMNQAVMADLAALQGLGQQAFDYTVPGMLMQARRAGAVTPQAQATPQATPQATARPRRTGTPRARATPQMTPQATPQMTPMPTPGPMGTPPPDWFGRAAGGVGAALASQLAPGAQQLGQGAAQFVTSPVRGVMGGLGTLFNRGGNVIEGLTRAGTVLGGIGAAGYGAARGIGSLIDRNPGAAETVGNAVQQVLPTQVSGVLPMATPTPTNAPTSAQSGALSTREEVEAMPDGSVFQFQGLGLVQRRGTELYPVTPTPTPGSQQAGRF